jgi:hypothetical protein
MTQKERENERKEKKRKGKKQKTDEPIESTLPQINPCLMVQKFGYFRRLRI